MIKKIEIEFKQELGRDKNDKLTDNVTYLIMVDYEVVDKPAALWFN